MIRDASPMDRAVVASTRWSRTQWIAALIAGGLIIAVALLYPAVHRWARADRATDAAALRFATVERGDLQRDVSVQGRVVAALHPTLFSSAQGVISLRTRAGTEVRKGDVLAEVNSPELRSALAQAQSQLASLTADYERQKITSRQAELRNRQQLDLLTVRRDAAKRALDRADRSFKEGVGNRADLEAAGDALHVATMEREQAAQELQLGKETVAFDLTSREQSVRRQKSVTEELQQRFDGLTMRAPFDGMVASINVQDRDAVAPNQGVLTIVNLSSYEIELTLPEEYATETKIGMPASINVNGRDTEGRVTAVSPEVVNGQVTATLAFAGNAPGGLKQSQRLTARLIFESKKNVVKVARGAWFDASGGHRVYVVENKVATRRDITPGASSVGEVEIVNGLSVGEQIVVSDTTPFDNAQTVLLR